ncbi:MAG TPA: hypothetical protein VEY91_08075 [Candidatus Limnocylindria bacterium]|nr:hypothetical protein [Candidatus Limnocylindria bacterium]
MSQPAARDLAEARGLRLRAPLLLALGALLAFEAAGGIVIFCARLVTGTTPGESLHVIAGVALTGIYAAYQVRHWNRVAPFRPRLDYLLGVIASLSLAATQATGLWLALSWWRDRVAQPVPGEVSYPAALTALHNIGSVAVWTFVSAHFGAVLMRDRRRES